MMALVAVAAVALWLLATARRVTRELGEHVWHIWQRPSTGELSMQGHSVDEAFWPRYRRALLGQPWPGDFACECRRAPDLERVEIASASSSAALLPLFNRLAIPYQRAVQHRQTADSLAASIAWDETRLAKLLEMAARAKAEGREIHGVDQNRADSLRTIEWNRGLLRYHEALWEKYRLAARRPWLPVPPDPPEPRLHRP